MSNPYDGLVRVTSIIKEIYGELEPGWLDMCGECLDKNVPTEEEILNWSRDFGEVIHSHCLENIPLSANSDLQNSCINMFEEFKEKFSPKTIEVEKVVCAEDKFKNKIYAGTLDWICYIKGEKWLIDIKTWGSWRYKFNYQPPRKEINSNKATKTNLQTKLYEHALGKKMKRAVLWITPGFYVFKEFKLPPRNFDNVLEIASKLSGANKLQF